MPAWANNPVAVTPRFMTFKNRGALGYAHFWPPVRGIEHTQLPGKQNEYDKKTAHTCPAVYTSCMVTRAHPAVVSGASVFRRRCGLLRDDHDYGHSTFN